MITSVFRYRGGAEEPVDPRIISTDTTFAEQYEMLRKLTEEIRFEASQDRSVFSWIKVADPTPAEMTVFRELYELPELQVEDAFHPRQRAKIEVGDHRAFIVLKELRYDASRSAVETGQVAVFLGPGYALSIRHGDAAPGSARERLRANLELTQFGPTAVLWAVSDVIVDEYLAIVNAIGDELEGVEEIVFSNSRIDHAGLIYNLKRENLEIKRAVGPLEPAARELAAERGADIPKRLSPYFHDVADHLLRAADQVETYDQLLMTMLSASTSQQDLRQNQDMRKISAWAAIIAVPTAIAGIYGMNFDQMPELHWDLGYPAVVLIMIVACIFLYRQFKKSGWL